MVGNQEQGSTETRNDQCSFQWDDQSHLFFHASSGFYHDPDAGWYYSSREGLYYKFEDGNYVLLESDKVSEAHQTMEMVSNETPPDNPCSMECITSEEGCSPHPPSEWMEETLINLYLMGYPNSATATTTDDIETALETSGSGLKDTHEPLDDHSCSERLPACSDGFMFEEIEESEQISEDMQDAPEPSGTVFDEDALWEENWRAQYGQVVPSVGEHFSSSPITDLWDWAMVSQNMKKKKTRVAWLLGRLVRKSTKLHPSLPSSGGLLKTAAICEVHLDLVRVITGQVYRLRSPSAKYLASLSIYDSSDPTKDWGFPDLCMDMHGATKREPSYPEGYQGSEASVGVTACDILFQTPCQLPSMSTTHKSHTYRDRAAERRTLHGGFGIGPGQKNEDNDNVDGVEPCSVPVPAEEAAAEAMHFSFGAGSYARRILEGMGWNEGEALGSTRKGLIEPLQAVGNKGCAGLGWNNGRS